MKSPTRSPSPWLVLFTLGLGTFAVQMVGSIVNVAIPDMMTSLHASLNTLLWVVNAYLLAYIVLLVTAGRLTDLFGPKPLFLMGVAGFDLGSLLCGLAASPAQLIGARVVQGVGAALLTPQALSLISQVFPKERRGTALGIWGVVAGGAVAAGPSIGGLLVGTLGWRWIFFVNLPIGVAALVIAAKVMPNPHSGRRHRLDLLGTSLLTVALFLIVYGLIEGEPRRWGSLFGPVNTAEVLAAGAVALAAFFRVEHARQHREPLLPFAILRERNFDLMALVAAALTFSVGSVFFLTLLYMQSAAGMSAFHAGLTTAAAPLVSVFFAPVSGLLTDRVGGKPVVLAGLLLMASGSAAVPLLARPDMTWSDLLPAMILFGLGMGIVFAPPGTLAMQNIDKSVAGAASGVFTTVRMCGTLLGGTLAGLVLQARLPISVIAATAHDHAALSDAIRFSFVLPVGALTAVTLSSLAVTRTRSAETPRTASAPSDATTTTDRTPVAVGGANPDK